MSPSIFIATLYCLSAASLVVGIADSSMGWFLGAAAAFAVAKFAGRLRDKESSAGKSAPRLGFFAVAMLAMLAAMSFLFWLQSSA